MRNFSILGGEPLCPENRSDVAAVIRDVRQVFPRIKIFVWTGYTFNYLFAHLDNDLKYILDNIDYLIDGLFEQDKRDLTLWLRGSTNQNVYKKENNKFIKLEDKA